MSLPTREACEKSKMADGGDVIMRGVVISLPATEARKKLKKKVIMFGFRAYMLYLWDRNAKSPALFYVGGGETLHK